ncbi:platelet binding protein GspB-like [Ptychodera flava]|uniref:platelet binding protein GspB-like n=1 Tax=Ptychodera flava TaxID=63121 RepID=UPI003969F8B3
MITPTNNQAALDESSHTCATSNLSVSKPSSDIVSANSDCTRRLGEGGDLSLRERSQPKVSTSASLSGSGDTSGGSERLEEIRKTESDHSALAMLMSLSEESFFDPFKVQESNSVNENNNVSGEDSNIAPSQINDTFDFSDRLFEPTSGVCFEKDEINQMPTLNCHRAAVNKSSLTSSFSPEASVPEPSSSSILNPHTDCNRRQGEGGDLSLGERSEPEITLKNSDSLPTAAGRKRHHIKVDDKSPGQKPADALSVSGSTSAGSAPICIKRPAKRVKATNKGKQTAKSVSNDANVDESNILNPPTDCNRRQGEGGDLSLGERSEPRNLTSATLSGSGAISTESGIVGVEQSENNVSARKLEVARRHATEHKSSPISCEPNVGVSEHEITLKNSDSLPTAAGRKRHQSKGDDKCPRQKPADDLSVSGSTLAGSAPICIKRPAKRVKATNKRKQNAKSASNDANVDESNILNPPTDCNRRQGEGGDLSLGERSEPRNITSATLSGSGAISTESGIVGVEQSENNVSARKLEIASQHATEHKSSPTSCEPNDGVSEPEITMKNSDSLPTAAGRERHCSKDDDKCRWQKTADALSVTGSTSAGSAPICIKRPAKRVKATNKRKQNAKSASNDANVDERNILNPPTDCNRRQGEGGDLSLGERSEPRNLTSATLSGSGAISTESGIVGVEQSENNVSARKLEVARRHATEHKSSPISCEPNDGVSEPEITLNNSDSLPTAAGRKRHHSKDDDKCPGQKPADALSVSGSTPAGSAPICIKRPAKRVKATNKRKQNAKSASNDANVDESNILNPPIDCNRRQGEGGDLSRGERSEPKNLTSATLSGSAAISTESGIVGVEQSENNVSARNLEVASWHATEHKSSPISCEPNDGVSEPEITLKNSDSLPTAAGRERHHIKVDDKSPGQKPADALSVSGSTSAGSAPICIKRPAKRVKATNKRKQTAKSASNDANVDESNILNPPTDCNRRQGEGGDLSLGESDSLPTAAGRKRHHSKVDDKCPGQKTADALSVSGSTSAGSASICIKRPSKRVKGTNKRKQNAKSASNDANVDESNILNPPTDCNRRQGEGGDLSLGERSEPRNLTSATLSGFEAISTESGIVGVEQSENNVSARNLEVASQHATEHKSSPISCEPNDGVPEPEITLKNSDSLPTAACRKRHHIKVDDKSPVQKPADALSVSGSTSAESAPICIKRPAKRVKATNKRKQTAKSASNDANVDESNILNPPTDCNRRQGEGGDLSLGSTSAGSASICIKRPSKRVKGTNKRKQNAKSASNDANVDESNILNPPTDCNRRQGEGGDLSLGERSEPRNLTSATLSGSGAISTESGIVGVEQSENNVSARKLEVVSLHATEHKSSPISCEPNDGVSEPEITLKNSDSLPTAAGRKRHHSKDDDKCPGQKTADDLSVSGSTSAGSAPICIKRPAKRVKATNKRKQKAKSASNDANVDESNILNPPTDCNRRQGEGGDLSLGERSEPRNLTSATLSGSGAISTESGIVGVEQSENNVSARKLEVASWHATEHKSSPISCEPNDGVSEPEITLGSSDADSTPSAKRYQVKAPQKRKKMSCPECKSEVFNLKRHFMQWHDLCLDKAKSKLKDYQKSKIQEHNKILDLGAHSGRLYKKCPIDFCFAMVKRLDHHISVVHGLGSTNPKYHVMLAKAHRDAQKESILIRQARASGEGKRKNGERLEELEGEGQEQC